MKVALSLAAFACLCAQTALGQITVDCVFEQKTFLVGEDVMAKVRVSNFSGRTLELGKEPDWIRLAVTPSDGGIASQHTTPDFSGPFELPSAKMATKHVNIARYYTFKPGRYSVVAQVNVPGYNEPFRGPVRVFDVVSGTTLWETLFGAPGGDGAGATRRYVLQKGHLGKDMKLYFKLTDASGAHTYRVFPLAGMVSFSNPETKVDQQSRLHVLHQYGARAFNYALISPDGELLKQERYDIAGSRPALRMNSQGEIIVLGGVKKALASDTRSESPAAETPEPPEKQPDDKTDKE